MKTKTLVILGGVLVASVTAVIIKMQSNADTFSTPPAIVGDTLLKDVQIDNINTIDLNDGKNKVALVLKDGKWVVPSRDDFPANVTSVNTLTDNAFALKVQEVLEVGKSQYGRLGLADAGEGVKPEETGKALQFKDTAGKELASLIVGRTQEKKPDDNVFNVSGPEPAPQWIKVGGNEAVYKTATGFSKLEADPKNWLDREKFFKVEKHKSITVTGPTPEESWKIFRETETGELKLDAPKPGEEFDTGKAASQGSMFSYISFDDILPAAEKDKAALDKPIHTAVIQTFDGLTYTIKVGAKVPPPPAGPGTDTSAATPPESHYISFTVDGKLDETVPAYTAPQPVAPTAPAADAKEEDKKKYEEAKKTHEAAMKTWEEGKKTAETTFQDQLKTKKEKLAAEQALQTRIFVVAKSTLDPVMKKRSDFMKDKAAAPAPGTATPTPGSNPAPGTPSALAPRVTPGTPLPAAGKTGKIEAVTPPIEVTIPGKEAPKEAPKVTPPPPPDAPKNPDAKKATDKKDTKKKPK